MTDQEFRELRSMIQRRVREARALGRVTQKRWIPHFAKKRFDGETDRRVQSPGTHGSRYPQVLRKT
jgi:hypothetical protein